MSNVIKLAVVDDHPIVIQGIVSLINNLENMHVVGSFQSGSALISFLNNHEIDIVLLDIMLPDGNGIELCAQVKKLSPKTVVIAISNHTERSIIMQILQNGASGYILKNASVEELKNGIETALRGELAFSREVIEIIAKPSVNDLKRRPKFTKREKQILQLIAQGKTTAGIADELFLSPLTVETHRRNMMQKLDVKNSIELINIATEQLLI
ncbi:putative transcriptional regulatory protein NarL [Pedobacter sp. Bi27]|uniref:response regulator n=1 Tax=unclassified Pedobacter TaxID=2628915 RepID=UPI001D7C3F8A|nr:MULTISPECIES: response regulator transcription factor [unclassified Pedobacter]CAH0160204.1 putative transcriptional regulatory protein NarL [Pedobacter sp. Bi36]CAH0184447.1 putative transcriptional regulatory protein NarL [Pedobacter sp. Bi27]CAH0216060.1 putative transcriptional regulatory protein NarL [Pedobacter sp. Bi126]